jgi:hypothetical protein
VLIIDEAYVHFAGPENMSTELVRQEKDVVVLRTFSKIYGMAGLRAGALYGRPDLLAKVAEYGRGGDLPVTATACAAASMKVGPSLMKWPQHIRVTVGTYEEMGKFNAALDLVVKEGPVKASGRLVFESSHHAGAALFRGAGGRVVQNGMERLLRAANEPQLSAIAAHLREFHRLHRGHVEHHALVFCRQMQPFPAWAALDPLHHAFCPL